MPTIQEGLKSALAQTPAGKLLLKSFKEQLWTYIKDHPGVKATALPSVFKRDTHQAVSNMKARGMLIYTKAAVHRSHQGKAGFTLTVNPKMQGVFELWPEPLKPEKQKQTVTLTIAPHQPADIPIPQPTLEMPTDIPPIAPVGLKSLTDIEHLTIKEARTLYMKLHSIFGAQHG